jgi:peptidyl-prolyl cis-trans isomerase SDCCAG10
MISSPPSFFFRDVLHHKAEEDHPAIAFCPPPRPAARKGRRVPQQPAGATTIGGARRSRIAASRDRSPRTMSTVYATEPPTSGRVAVETTHGPLEVRLWCRECPATTRLFLQLCLDGYYDGMVFHRIVPGFLVQTGAVRHRLPGSRDAPSGAAGRKEEAEAEDEGEMERYRRAVGADAALERRRYELHSRLRFSHRGIVAAALPARDDEGSESGGGGDAAGRAAAARRLLQPQFFVTLDEAGFLDGKHVAFGTCSGPTFFNALRISQVEVDALSHEPVDLEGAPRVTAVRILECPFDDLVPQTSVPWKKKEAAEEEEALSAAAQQKKRKRKGRLDKNVLSFGDEVEPDLLPAPAKRREAAAKEAKDSEVDAPAPESRAEDGLPSTLAEAKNGAEEAAALERGEASTFEAPISQTEQKHDECAPRPKGDQGLIDSGEGAGDDPPRARPPEKLPAAKEAAPASLVEARRARYAQKGRAATSAAAGSADDRRRREEETMAKLLAFRSGLKGSKRAEAAAAGGGPGRGGGDDGLASRMARRVQRDEPDGPGGNGAGEEAYRGQVLDRDEEEAAEPRSRDWMLTKFQCRRHTDLLADDGGAGGDGRWADDYRVVDDRRRQRDRGHGGDGSRGEERRHRKDRHPRRHKGHHQHHNDRHA